MSETIVLNYGSLNIDYVYRVDHVTRPGETISSRSLQVFAGGKGANQTVALAKAGARAWHAGKIGQNARWLVDRLSALGVDTQYVRQTDEPTGHAVIQVDASGENAIFLFPGTNRQQARTEIDETLAAVPGKSLVLLQNEINEVPYTMQQARQRGHRICFNPAPYEPAIRQYPLDLVDVLVVNEIEGQGLSGKTEPDDILSALAGSLPRCDIVLTLGEHGVLHRSSGETTRVPAVKTRVVDTTAAGDTFIGYYLAAYVRGEPVRACLETACKAAAICVSRPGASDSIPSRDEVNAWRPEQETPR